MKAIFEVEFNPDDMISEEELNNYYDGSWMKVMSELFESDGIGIFSNDLKLIKVLK
jgi:hypothetical protein